MSKQNTPQPNSAPRAQFVKPRTTKPPVPRRHRRTTVRIRKQANPAQRRTPMSAGPTRVAPPWLTPYLTIR